jgi:hypothetical protein
VIAVLALPLVLALALAGAGGGASCGATASAGGGHGAGRASITGGDGGFRFAPPDAASECLLVLPRSGDVPPALAPLPVPPRAAAWGEARLL